MFPRNYVMRRKKPREVLLHVRKYFIWGNILIRMRIFIEKRSTEHGSSVCRYVLTSFSRPKHWKNNLYSSTEISPLWSLSTAWNRNYISMSTPIVAIRQVCIHVNTKWRGNCHVFVCFIVNVVFTVYLIYRCVYLLYCMIYYIFTYFEEEWQEVMALLFQRIVLQYVWHFFKVLFHVDEIVRAVVAPLFGPHFLRKVKIKCLKSMLPRQLESNFLSKNLVVDLSTIL